MTAASDAALQRDSRASMLRSQAKNRKADVEILINRAFSSSSRQRAIRGGRGGGHVGQSGRVLDSNLEFARKNLRNTYINLLFTCTFTKPAHGVDSLIWTDTYSLISAFRTQISTLKKAAETTVPPKTAKLNAEAARLRNELRRLLDEEQVFWQELIARVVRTFSLDEARSNLQALGIQCGSDGDTIISSSQQESFNSTGVGRQTTEPDSVLSQAALLPVNRQQLIEIVHRGLIFCGDIARYRQLHFQSSEPSDNPERGLSARGGRGGRGRVGQLRPAVGERQVSITEEAKYDFAKASAFYEQARLLLPDSGNPSNQLAVIAAYNGDVFLSIYHYYRALCVRSPFEKSKFNLDKVLKKPVDAWVESGLEEKKQWTLENYMEERREVLTQMLANNVSASEELSDRWLNHVVVLHGLFFHRVHLDCIVPLSQSVLVTFNSLVRARALQADQIVRVIVAGLCASWTTRLWRNSPSSAKADVNDTRIRPRPQSAKAASGRKSKRGTSDPETRLCIERQILAHVLGIFRELVEVDIQETREAIKASRTHPPSEPAAARGLGNSAGTAAVRNLTAVVRRTLPALRIATKWMKTHLEYIQRSSERAASSSQGVDSAMSQQQPLNQSLEAIPNEEEMKEAAMRARVDLDAVKAIDGFWKSYVTLINVLRYAFPFESLPNIGSVGPVGAPALCLEEDSDMRGFAPTKKATQSSLPGIGTINVGIGEACATINAVRPSQVHPNEEQLMRIADLLIDAKVVAESDASPITFDDEQNTFVYDGRIAAEATQRKPIQQVPAPSRGAHAPSRLAESTVVASAPARGAVSAANQQQQQDETSSEGYSEMTEDPVELAMRAVDGRRTGEGSVMDGMEESLRGVHMEDADGKPARSRGASENPLIPSQVKLNKFVNEAEIAMLFSQQPPGHIGGAQHTMSHLPSGDHQHHPTGPATANDLLLQVLQGRSQVASASTPGRHSDAMSAQPHLLFGAMGNANGSPTGLNQGSIWSRGPADSHLPVGSPPQASGFGAANLAPGTPPSGYPWNPIVSAAYGAGDPHSMFNQSSMTPPSSLGYGANMHSPFGMNNDAGLAPHLNSQFAHSQGRDNAYAGRTNQFYGESQARQAGGTPPYAGGPYGSNQPVKRPSHADLERAFMNA